MRLVRNAKQIALLAIGIANQKYGAELLKQQEVLMSISDIIMEALAMESSLLRSRKFEATALGPLNVVPPSFLCFEPAPFLRPFDAFDEQLESSRQSF